MPIIIKQPREDTAEKCDLANDTHMVMYIIFLEGVLAGNVGLEKLMELRKHFKESVEVK